MNRMIYSVLIILCIFLVLSAAASYGEDNSQEDGVFEAGRYQIYDTEAATLLLDTKSGKVWKVSSDMSGKLKLEGVTVEGVAYSSSDLDALNRQVNNLEALNQLNDKDKKQCREDIIGKFSYQLEPDKLNKILKDCRKGVGQ